MNSKLEPDGEKINKDKLYSILNDKNEIMDKPITNKNELKQFVENTIKKSNFSTRNMEAFLNVKNTYYRLDNNNNILSKKFLRLESKSQLLRLSSEKENKFNIVNDIKKINEESKDINNYMNNIIDNNNENNEGIFEDYFCGKFKFEDCKEKREYFKNQNKYIEQFFQNFNYNTISDNDESSNEKMDLFIRKKIINEESYLNTFNW
jgi:hypothetical protein